MDVLNKIKELKDEKGWSVYRLADEAGLTQSTVANMFARQTYPSITTLQQICSAFGITLTEFFALEDNSKKDEIELLSSYRKLSNRDKQIVLNLVKSMNDNA